MAAYFFRKVPGLRCFERGLHPEWCVFAVDLETAIRYIGDR
jgi:hypothetical protein